MNNRFLSPLLLLAAIFLMLAVIALGFDVAAWVREGEWMPVPLGQAWYSLDSESLNLAQAVVQRYLSANLWDTLVLPLLTLPTWVVPAALGGFFLFLKLAVFRS